MMATWTLPTVAGAVATLVFLLSSFPMLVKALKTKDMTCYSVSNIGLANMGNLVYWLYVSSLPVGPIWVLHTFYTISTLLMLIGYVHYTHTSPNPKK